MDNFQWTDALVKEMLYSKLPLPDHYMCNAQKCLDEFKKSKEKDIHKPDWEVLRYSFKEIILPANNPDIKTIEYSLNHGYKIHAVLRIHDGEIFTIGDDTEIGKITAFKICADNKMQVLNVNEFRWQWLFSIDKVKPKVPLFTTEDGVVYEHEGLKYAFLNTFNWTYITKVTDKDTYPSQYPFLYFSSIEKVKEYILLNKPIEVSYKEIFEFCKKSNYKETQTPMKDFFKSKINP